MPDLPLNKASDHFEIFLPGKIFFSAWKKIKTCPNFYFFIRVVESLILNYFDKNCFI